MNSKTLRRLASDHATLHSNLPPNYLFPANADSDDLTQLDVLLAGPEGTPYAAGLFKLHLDIPNNYPTAPPTAHFRTRIWHPNVEEATGAVCVDTLKRDWQAQLTLRDILVTISCLLIQPNPASALNAEAGALLQEDWDAFCRRARLMAGIHSQVPRDLRQSVEEAKGRGEEKGPGKELDRDPEKGKGKGKKTEMMGSAVKTCAKGKGKAVAEKASTTAATDQEENLERSRRGSDDWIPAPPVFATPIGTNTLGHRSTAAGPEAAEAMQLEATAAQIPSTPLASIQTPGTANAPARASRQNSTLAQQASFHTPKRAPPAATSPERPLSSASSQSSLNTRLNTLSFSWAPEKPSAALKNSPEAARRERHESRRFKAAGYCLKRYNRGAFGPRKGLKRL